MKKEYFITKQVVINYFSTGIGVAFLFAKEDGRKGCKVQPLAR
ncbi:MAG: hypothetical protein OEL83_06390 [Desulforhopalus sp.]|nr:hypothetical protein [Desulforhopalus sp.]